MNKKVIASVIGGLALGAATVVTAIKKVKSRKSGEQECEK